MSTHRYNGRASLCSFTFAGGRHCRTPRAEHPKHARKKSQNECELQLFVLAFAKSSASI
jgi:hypothetical protein